MVSGSPTKPTSVWKGKARATQTDFSDLNPVITYRHLHSRNLGVKDPLRVIALCDSDAFYAACEQVRLGIDPSIPLVVRQWEALIAVNYPARTFGITRMEKVKDALKRCPHLVVQHVATYREGDPEPGYWDNPDTLTHKVSLDYYRRESWKIYHMFKDGMPTAEIEKASIDEAFIDFTGPVRDEILKRYPYLAEVPSDAPEGKDTPLPPPPPISWDGLGTVIPVNPPPPPPSETETKLPDDNIKAGESAASDLPEDTARAEEKVEDTGAQEADGPPTWHDVALSIAAEMMAKVRNDVHTKLGYTMTAGIARNKFLAKLTASYKKPNNQSILRNAAIPNYLRPLPFQKIRFLGGKLGTALAEGFDVKTVGDLLTVSLDEMQSKFGEESIWVWELLRGIDRGEVKEKPPITKSMLASKNLPKPITKTADGHHWIRVLSAELALRLREARESIPALWPKSLVLHVRQGYETSRSRQAPFPFIRDATVDVIAAAGDRLWKELVGNATDMKITIVQLSFAGIDSMETGQKRIEGFFSNSKPPSSTGVSNVAVSGSTEKDVKDGLSNVNTNTSIDGGSRKRKRASSTAAASASAQHDTSTNSNNRDGDRPMSAVDEGNIDAGKEVSLHRANSSLSELSNAQSFVCDRCGKRILLPEGDVGFGGGGGDDSEDAAVREARLVRLRGEHDDFHFAEDLANQIQGGGADDEYSSGSGVKRVTIRPSDTSSTTRQSGIGNSSGGGTVKKRKKPAPRLSKDKNKDKDKDVDGKGQPGIAKFFTQSHR